MLHFPILRAYSSIFKNKSMKNILTLILLLKISMSMAQTTYQITGLVLDQDNKGLDLSSVDLLTQSDSSLVKTEFTDEDGSFLMSNIEEGAYILLIKQFGYLNYTERIEINSSKELPAITLVSDINELGQVNVTATVPFVVRKIDRVVITPDALIANAGSNALEVLERAPGVSVDQNGTILLKGRSGVAVFINDKPSYLSGTELENYLRTLPAGSIKNIEIMENPPAQYDAAGSAGVININIKRGTMKGFHGNTSLSYRRSRYNGSNNSLNLNYNREKISVSSSIYAGFYGSFQDLNINRYYFNEDLTPKSSFAQNSFGQNSGQYVNARIGLDFYPTDKTTFGVGYRLASSPTTREIDNTALVSDVNGALTQKIVADNISERTFQNNLVNAFFSKDLDTLGSKFSIDADFVQYVSSNDQAFKNFQYDANELLIYEDEINGEIPSEINIYALKTDYTKTLKGDSKIEGGLKSVLSKTDNEAIYSNTVAGVTTPDYNLSNRFLYDEWINAAYVNYRTSIGKVALQLGLRGEMTQLTGNQLGNAVSPDTSFTRNYASLFPTFYASRKLDSAGIHNLNFTYGRRINRPYFQDLNPFISPLDKFTFYTGNPNLLPTFSHNLGLNYSFKNMINTSLSYALTTNGIAETLEIQDSIYFSRPGNIASGQNLSLGVDGAFKVTPWYRINAYAAASFVKFDSQLYTEQLNTQGFNFYFSATNSFNFGKGWKIDVSGSYMSDQIASQLIIKGFAMLNCGVQKKILDGKGSIKISVNDLLYSRIGSGIINNLRLTDADWNSKMDSRSVRVAFSLRFGKSNSNKKKYESSGSDTEQDRVRG